MLLLPSKGFSKSNLDLNILCDWIETNILFDEQETSITDIVEVLKEEDLFEDQDTAYSIVSDAWAELRRRQSWIGQNTPFIISNDLITRKRSWEDSVDYTFCLLLSLARLYRGWSRRFGSDFTKQGELFEEITRESLQQQFSNWHIYSTGWSRTRAKKLSVIVKNVSDLLGEKEGNVYKWTKPKAKDAGLDILCFRPFPDGRVAIPVYLLQCASGEDFEEKLHTPEIQIWIRVIDFVVAPNKAFATPFAFADNDFVMYSNRVKGLFIDRYRILSAGYNSGDWISPNLKQRLIEWSEERIEALPRRENVF